MNLRIRTTLLVSSISMLILGCALPATAQGQNGCSLKSVAGTFGYITSGTRVGIGPVAGVGSLTFTEDGDVVDGKQTVSFGGIIATETYSGTYTVGDDCHGSFTVVVVSSVPAFNRTSTLAVVWEDDSNRAQAMFTGAGTIITADAHKLFPRGN
jgi:hypothetical protein